MSFLINPYVFGGYDPDAANYISRVQTADGQALESSVKDLINDLFVGVKADGIFGALKACCILSAARTIPGALTPLLSSMPAPTNVGFVAGNYDRKTGLGDSGNSSKYLDTNRLESADPDNSHHAATFVTAVDPRFPSAINSAHLGVLNNQQGTTISIESDSNVYGWSRSDFLVKVGSQVRPTQNSLFGIARNGASNATIRVAGNNYIRNPQPPGIYTTGKNSPYYVFAVNNNSVPGNYCCARLSYYSIGESLNLALLDARVSTFMSSLAALSL